MGSKRAAYARLGEPEYWIIDPALRTISLLLLEGDAYSELGPFADDDQLPSRVLPGLTTPVRHFFPR